MRVALTFSKVCHTDCARLMEVSQGGDLGGPSACCGALGTPIETQSDIRTDGEDSGMVVSLDQSSEDLAEESDLSQFVSTTCDCELGPKKTPCSSFITRATYLDCRRCMELGHDELDLVVLAQVQAHRTVPGQKTVQKSHHRLTEEFRPHTDYYIHGVKICHTTFLFLHCMSEHRYTSTLRKEWSQHPYSR